MSGVTRLSLPRGKCYHMVHTLYVVATVLLCVLLHHGTRGIMHPMAHGPMDDRQADYRIRGQHATGKKQRALYVRIRTQQGARKFTAGPSNFAIFHNLINHRYQYCCASMSTP